MLPPFRLPKGRSFGARLPALVLAVLLALFRLFLSGDTRYSAALFNNAIYLPLVVSKPLPPVDLAVTALEVTQAVQTSNNSVPLVANRPAVIRVYVQRLKGELPDEALILVTATRGGVSLGTVSVGPRPVPSLPSRNDYASTFNAELPADWLFGRVEVVARVEVSGAARESNESNNSATLTLDFNEVPPLAIKIVPIDYTHLGTRGAGFYPGTLVDPVSEWLMGAFPISDVEVTFHPGYSFSGDLSLSSEWARLLAEVTTLKAVEGAPGSQVYYALVPTRRDDSRWFYAGIAGIGWVGHRVSVGLDLGDPNRTGSLAGHEIGHNFGRGHAPCGFPGNVDGQYPYAGASTGHFGLSVPGNMLFDPAVTRDVMGYCHPKWVSDYTYQALYADQRVNGLTPDDALTAAHPALLIQARFDSAGVPWLEPVYTFPQIPTPPVTHSDYTIELLDSAGNILAAQPVPVLEAAEPDVTARFIQASLPLPATPVARVRLLHGGMVIAERALSGPAPLSRAPDTASSTVWTVEATP